MPQLDTLEGTQIISQQFGMVSFSSDTEFSKMESSNSKSPLMPFLEGHPKSHL